MPIALFMLKCCNNSRNGQKHVKPSRICQYVVKAKAAAQTSYAPIQPFTTRQHRIGIGRFFNHGLWCEQGANLILLNWLKSQLGKWLMAVCRGIHRLKHWLVYLSARHRLSWCWWALVAMIFCAVYLKTLLAPISAKSLKPYKLPMFLWCWLPFLISRWAHWWAAWANINFMMIWLNNIVFLYLKGAWADILGQEKLRSDQIHANAAGYRLFAEKMAAFLQQQGFY